MVPCIVLDQKKYTSNRHFHLRSFGAESDSRHFPNRQKFFISLTNVKFIFLLIWFCWGLFLCGSVKPKGKNSVHVIRCVCEWKYLSSKYDPSTAKVGYVSLKGRLDLTNLEKSMR